MHQILRGGQITSNRGNIFASQEFPQLGIAVASKEATQIFGPLPIREIASQKPFNRVGYLRSQAAVADRPCGRLMQA